MIKSYEDVQSLAELAEVEPNFDRPSRSELEDVRSALDRAFREVTDRWSDRPHGPLRITKGRLQSTATCHAQVLGEAEPFVLDSDVAMGAICDIAAGMVTVHPSFDPSSGWYQALQPALLQERPDVVSLVEDFSSDQAEMFFEMTDERCARLRGLIGDVRQAQPTIRERARVQFDGPGVLLSAETDLATRTPGPVITEVKSGKFGPWIIDELRFYALVRSLRDLQSPSFGCAISLADGNLTAIPIRIEDLDAAARRVVDAVEALVDIDRFVSAGRPVPTRPGNHCRWCRRVHICPDVSESILAEVPAPRYPEVDFDEDF